MSRAPFVMAKAEAAFQRSVEVFDTTIGWRFINPRMQKLHGSETMPETGENVATKYGICRADQDAFALRSQQRTALAQTSGVLEGQIFPMEIPGKAGSQLISKDEHPRAGTTLEALTKLKPIVRPDGTVTAGNASGVNDGSAILLIASEAAATEYGLTPLARFAGMTSAGVAPGLMGMGPVPAVRKLLAKLHWKLNDVDVIELNEAFASQALACLRELGLPDDSEHVNPHGGAIALGHPLGMSGARMLGNAAQELARRGGKRALVTMCVGVGQGLAVALERN
jgi:3-oxoadipyl-CoA thiolase